MAGNFRDIGNVSSYEAERTTQESMRLVQQGLAQETSNQTRLMQQNMQLEEKRADNSIMADRMALAESELKFRQTAELFDKKFELGKFDEQKRSTQFQEQVVTTFDMMDRTARLNIDQAAEGRATEMFKYNVLGAALDNIMRVVEIGQKEQINTVQGMAHVAGIFGEVSKHATDQNGILTGIAEEDQAATDNMTMALLNDDQTFKSGYLKSLYESKVENNQFTGSEAMYAESVVNSIYENLKTLPGMVDENGMFTPPENEIEYNSMIDQATNMTITDDVVNMVGASPNGGIRANEYKDSRSSRVRYERDQIMPVRNNIANLRKNLKSLQKANNFEDQDRIQVVKAQIKNENEKLGQMEGVLKSRMELEDRKLDQVYRMVYQDGSGVHVGLPSKEGYENARNLEKDPSEWGSAAIRKTMGADSIKQGLVAKTRLVARRKTARGQLNSASAFQDDLFSILQGLSRGENIEMLVSKMEKGELEKVDSPGEMKRLLESSYGAKAEELLDLFNMSEDGTVTRKTSVEATPIDGPKWNISGVTTSTRKNN